jgi:hypothetical protein
VCSVFINGQAVVTAMAASLQGFKSLGVLFPAPWGEKMDE